MLLRAYRHLRPNEDDTFSMLTSDALLDFWNQLTGAIAATAVAVVSVISGGGRSGDHEHHAGRGDGADARNRHPQIVGSRNGIAPAERTERLTYRGWPAGNPGLCADVERSSGANLGRLENRIKSTSV